MMMNRLKLAGLCCLMAGTAVAQYKNIEITTFASDSKYSIPAVAISRKDAKFLTVKGPGNVFYLSADQGTTWEAISANGFEQAEWMTLLSDSKVLYAVYATPEENRFRVVVAQSKDNGKTWGAPVGIFASGGSQKYPAATFDAKGNLFVTWTESGPGADGKCESVIMGSSSSGGSKWSKPLRVSQAGGSCEEDNKYVTGGVPAFGADGKMFIAWSNADKIYMDRSFSFNMWLENDIEVNTITPGWKQQVGGYPFVAHTPQLMIDQSKGAYRGCLYLSWADQRSGDEDTDVWFSRSNNYGDNWSAPNKLGTAEALTDQYGPRMAVDQSTGYLYVLFYDRGAHEDDQTDVVLAYSSESGGSFKTVTISEAPFTADQPIPSGVYLDIAAYGGIVVPVWTRSQDGKTSLWTTTIRQDELIQPVAQPKAKKKK